MEQPTAKLLRNKYDLYPIICVLYHYMFAHYLYLLDRQMPNHMYYRCYIPHAKRLKIVITMKLLCRINERNIRVYIHLLARRGCFSSPLLC